MTNRSVEDLCCSDSANDNTISKDLMTDCKNVIKIINNNKNVLIRSTSTTEADNHSLSAGNNNHLQFSNSIHSIHTCFYSHQVKSDMVQLKNVVKHKKFLSIVIYGICVTFISINLYVLLNRKDTIYYLRLYHLAVGIVMVLCGSTMLAFIWKTRKANIPTLLHPHSLPRPTLISAFLLTAGIVLGYSYLFVFNIALSNCDKLIDATTVDEQWQEGVYSLLMIGFCLLSLIYILQRSYYGALDTHFDVFTRQWINTVLTIVWIKIVIFKGYLSYQELCERKEISGYWCPIVRRHYECEPEFELKGTQKIWYYLHKGLLSSSIISCSSEFFPVMLVSHWLVCGSAEEHADELIRKRKEKKSVRRILYGLMGNVSQVYGIDRPNLAELTTLEILPCVKYFLGIGAWFTGGIAIFRWAIGFYFSMNFDKMHDAGSMADDVTELLAGCAQLCLFFATYRWALTVEEKRFDAHHKAESRGDLILIFGSVIFMALKFLLQLLELNFQHSDGFLKLEECIIRALSLSIMHASEWLQFLCLRRIMALHRQDIYSTRSFLPSVALCAIITNWVGFGMTFFETNLIKYQLSKPEFHFSQTTLVSMIFTQTIYPADYLFMFTAAGCWTDVLLRYFEMGLFSSRKLVLRCNETVENASPQAARCSHSELTVNEVYCPQNNSPRLNYNKFDNENKCKSQQSSNDKQSESSITEDKSDSQSPETNGSIRVKLPIFSI